MLPALFSASDTCTLNTRMKIHHATEWSKTRDVLRVSLRGIAYNHDLHRLLSNIDTMVGELSKAEVEARRTRVYSVVNELLNTINDSITRLDKLIVWATLRQ